MAIMKIYFLYIGQLAELVLESACSTKQHSLADRHIALL